MNLFKKVSLLVLFGVMVFTLTGCGKAKNIEGKLDDLMTKVYENIPEDERPMMLTNIELTNETAEYYLGTANIDFDEALVSESATGSVAHSVVLIRTKANADIDAIKKEIKDKANPAKWICVQAEEVAVENNGNLIILIMTDAKDATKIKESFKKL